MLLVVVTNAQVNRIGSGTALYFAGTSANQHIDLDTVARLFATSDFTVELWERLDSATGATSDIPFICNKDWANGANKGFVISKMSTATPSVWVNFTTASGSRFDLKNVPAPTLLTAWTHIAVTFNRNGSSPKIIVYINGIAADSGALNTSTHVPTSSIVGSQHTRLAQDGTGAYSWGFKYKGYMDEVRIWKGVRTANEIRSNMCHKLTGTETNLLSYYNFNDGSGTTLRNLVSGVENGVLKNMAGTTEWVRSGAAIGDSSVYNYPTTWASGSLQMNSAANGKLTVNNITGPVGGMQIYRVDTTPNTYNGINNNGGNNTYYGVFVAQKPITATAGSPVTYDAYYDYSTYSSAVTNHANIKLYNRYGNEYTTWADLSAANNTSTNTFADSFMATRREFIIGDFASVSCANPVNPYSDSVSATFARVKWTGGGSQWQVQYGPQCFMLGAGTFMSVSGSPVANLTGLTAGVTYDVYVRRICGAGDTSEWTG
ncbi:MAG: LamG domain-containing protein, partial [Chitinophagia bacterium]|nr:LamG domain-containing protein [Chitinophagia bacterium]